MSSRMIATAAAFAALTLAPMAASATETQDAGSAPNGRNCFWVNNWDGWSAPGNGDVLYLRVHINDIYRVDLTPGSHAWKGGDNFLVNQVRGSNLICSAIDLDLTLADHLGFRRPLIARSLRKLTPAEVAAIPRKDLP